MRLLITLKTAVLGALVAGTAPSALARDVPESIEALRSAITNTSDCGNKLGSGFYSMETSSPEISYCGDYLVDYGIVYLRGPGSKLTNMDIDCDGQSSSFGIAANDSRCGSSDDTQFQTSFVDTVTQYGKGVLDLDAYVHSYVVFGNSGSKRGYRNFDPQEVGVEPLSVMAVVCNNKMFYGVWGDQNGDETVALVGEASIALATACFGKGVNGNSGHDEDDVLFLAFTGSDAVPGADGAKWDAANFEEFEESLGEVGDSLVGRISNTTDYDYGDSDDGDSDDSDSRAMRLVTDWKLVVAAGIGNGILLSL